MKRGIKYSMQFTKKKVIYLPFKYIFSIISLKSKQRSFPVNKGSIEFQTFTPIAFRQSYGNICYNGYEKNYL